MSKPYTLQTNPFIVPTTDGKHIEEHFGLATTGENAVSIARMIAPPGWGEPFQRPEFDEYTFIIRGRYLVEIEGEECEYLAICLPAFSMATVNREE